MEVEANVSVAPASNPLHGKSTSKKKEHSLSQLIEKHAYNATDLESNQRMTDIHEEIHKYLLTVIPKGNIDNFEILKFWKDNCKSLPRLARLARKILCIPATSTSSERAFSHAGLLINAKRSSLGPTVVEKTLFLHD